MNRFAKLYSLRGQSIKGSAIRKILAVTQQPGIISFAGGLPNDAAIPTKLITKLINEILGQKPLPILQYSITEGLPRFRQFLCTLMNQRYKLSYTLKETLITTGSQQAIDLAAETLLDRGDTVIVERPTYLAALQIFQKVGANIVEADCDQSGIIIPSIKKILKKRVVKLIYTNPDHQNPSGFELPEPRREELVKVALKYAVPILEDGAYREIKFAGKPLLPIAAFDKQKKVVLFSQTASKILAPGLRVGWVQGPKQLINKMALLKQSIDVHTPGLNQEIVYRYLSGGYFDKHLGKIISLYQNQAQQMNQALTKYAKDTFSWQRPTGGMFIWASVKRNIDVAKELERIVKKYQVAYVPGSPFFAHNPEKQTLRLNFTKATNRQIWEGIKRLAEGFNR